MTIPFLTLTKKKEQRKEASVLIHMIQCIVKLNDLFFYIKKIIEQLSLLFIWFYLTFYFSFSTHLVNQGEQGFEFQILGGERDKVPDIFYTKKQAHCMGTET
jgi:hypothetical protein